MSKVALGGGLPDNPANSVVGLDINPNQKAGACNAHISTTKHRTVIKK
jgi:hypothetical protein